MNPLHYWSYEIVSKGTKIIDHRRKRAEYNVLEIPECCLVDLIEDEPKYPPGVTILTLVEGFYEQAVFRLSDRIISETFPELTLTAEQVLSPWNHWHGSRGYLMISDRVSVIAIFAVAKGESL